MARASGTGMHGLVSVYALRIRSIILYRPIQQIPCQLKMGEKCPANTEQLVKQDNFHKTLRVKFADIKI